MKKIILGIVFVFASFTMVNANSNVEILENEMRATTCEEVAGNFSSLAYEAGISVVDCIEIYDIIMANCTEN